MGRPPLIQQLALRNYKSVAHCTLRLQPLTFLVGRNGSGKSNVLDALRFVSDALGSTLEFAMRERGGIDQVRRRSRKSRPPNFGIAVRVTVPEGHADYRFEIGPVNPRGHAVLEESCVLVRPFLPDVRFTVRNGAVEWTLDHEPPIASPDRLFLVAASGISEFRPVHEALAGMAFHNLTPDAMKQPSKPEQGSRLAYDGHNLASVVKELQHSAPHSLERAAEYLRAIGVPITAIQHRQLGAFETVEFEQELPGDVRWRFDASSMSDGTSRALGILISVLSPADANETDGKASNGRMHSPTLVGIEEPESALHPAASAALVDALIEGSRSTQVLVTCHSPDLLEHADLDPSSIFVVINDDGATRVAPLGEATKTMLREHLTTAAELQRQDQLAPDPEDLKRQERKQGELFPDGE